MDHVYLKDGSGFPGIGGVHDLLVVADVAKGIWYAEPTTSQAAPDTYIIVNFLKGRLRVRMVYADGFKIFTKDMHRSGHSV